ncbi:MAG TPA: thioredoxin family protein [archaeon]|nr:thioredoxin family protein [archaeon]
MRIENPALLLVVLVVVAGLVYFIQSMKPAVQDSPGPVGLEGEMDDLLYPRAPELAGIAGYVNVEQGFTLESVKGKVVLVDFWTYSCINCIRTLPYLTAWHEKYKDKGLVIVGAHTPEFEFEKDPENVKRAVEKHGIEYVVVQDNDYATWRAYRNRFWPHKYLVDAEGFVRYDHIGEGAYDETEDVIRKLLMERD